MQNQHEENEFEEKPKKRRRPRSSMSFVDFMRVEDIGTMPGQTPFEMETKRRMAALSKTPADELMSAEESRSEQVFKCASFRMLKGLIRRRGFLPRRLRLAYELCYVSKLPDPEAAYLMGITPVHMRKVRQNLRQSLVRALKKKEQDELLLRKAKFLGLTRRQERIVRLRFCEGFSVEEIANMTGVKVEPVKKTSRRAILPVLVEVSLLTFLLGIAMNAIPGLTGHTEDMLRALGIYYVGPWFGQIISITFGFLLLSAGNTAISDLVSIQFVLAKDRELPPIFSKLNRFGMPWLALIVATTLPVFVLIIEKDIVHLAALYAIGVVGAIALNLGTCATNFSIRLKSWERVLLTAGGIITLFIEVTIAIQKHNALFFVITIVGVGLALRYAAKMIAPAPMPELASNVNLLTVAEAKELTGLYKSSAFVALKSFNPVLLEEAALHVKAMGENSVYLGYVEEAPPSPELPTEIEPSRESVEVLGKAQEKMEALGITAVPIWQIGDNPGHLIARAAQDLDVKTVAIGTTRRSALISLLRGDVLRTLAHSLRKDCHLLIVG